MASRFHIVSTFHQLVRQSPQCQADDHLNSLKPPGLPGCSAHWRAWLEGRQLAHKWVCSPWLQWWKNAGPIHLAAVDGISRECGCRSHSTWANMDVHYMRSYMFTLPCERKIETPPFFGCVLLPLFWFIHLVFSKARATINNFVYGCGLPFMALLELMCSETILASNFDKAPLVVQTNNDQKYQLQNTKNIVPNHKSSKKTDVQYCS